MYSTGQVIIQGKKSLVFKFAIFRWLNRAHQELFFKKNRGKNVFFLRRLTERKSFSILIILIDRWQVLSYLIRMPLLNQANHAIWQKSWSTSIVFTAFPWILEVNGSKEEKRAYPFSFSTSKLLRRVGFEISRERHGVLLQSRKMAKKWRQSSYKAYWNYREIEYLLKAKALAPINARSVLEDGWL